MASRRYDTRSAIPALVVLLGFAASFFTFSLVRQAEKAAEETRFDDRARQAAARLADVIAHETGILSRLRDLYRILPPPDEKALEALSYGLFHGDERDPALSFVGWVMPLDPVGVGGYELEKRQDWPDESDFRVHGPDGQSSEARADQLSDGYRHWVLDQVAPHVPGGRLHGLDLSSDGAARDAIREAVTTGQLTASRRMALVEPTPETGDFGVLLVLPVYRTEDEPRTPEARQSEVAGVVVAALALRPLFARAFPSEAIAGEQEVSVTVTENDVLLGSVGPEGLAGVEPSPIPVQVANTMRWWLNMRPAEPMRRTFMDWLDRTSVVLPPAIFVVMCLVSWIVWTQQRQTAVIHEQVDQQTTELRRQNVELAEKEHELADANRRLLEMSNTDALTGILNRRALEVQLDKERERSRRTSTPFGLLIFDIDYFKDYNDRYGHAAGDDVLRRVAQLMHNEARRIDTVARYGGEEFVILTTGTDPAGLMAFGERVRQRIQQAAIENAASPHRSITVSGGGALSSVAGGDPRTVFDLADRCLYQAKSTGRNRVVMVM